MALMVTASSQTSLPANGNDGSGPAGPDFATRRQQLLELAADVATPKPADDLYGNAAIARLFLGRDRAAANTQLQWVARWFERPGPKGHDVRGESDFAAIKLATAHHLFRGTDRLEKATVTAMEKFFLEHNFESIHQSENHQLLFHTSRYLMASAWPERVFQAWGQTGAELAAQDRAWLERFIRYRAAYGWAEFDSSCYLMADLEGLLPLSDYAPDPSLSRLAGMMTNMLLADAQVDSLHGMIGGAQGRIYARHALDHAKANTWPIFYLYFGEVSFSSLGDRSTKIEMLTSRFEPLPIVEKIALDRQEPYVNRERKHLHNLLDVLPKKPLAGSIRKYTYWTPDFVMGCVQKQDAYPPGTPLGTTHYAWHEQHDWDLTFGTRPKARIFTHHPGKLGNEHGYWTGDMGCGCGHFFEQKSVLLALYDIPANQPYQQIHAYVPRDALEEVIDEGDWIFIREGRAYAALKFVGGHQWVTENEWAGVEVRSQACGRVAVVCQAGEAGDFPDFAAFRRQVMANDLQCDAGAMRLTYRSEDVGTLTLDASGQCLVDGQPVDLDYPLYDSPYMESAWGSGVIDLRHGRERTQLDFRLEK